MTHPLHREAEVIATRELARRRRLLADLPSDRRLELERLVERTATALADAVLDASREEPRLAHALDSIYGGISLSLLAAGD